MKYGVLNLKTSFVRGKDDKTMSVHSCMKTEILMAEKIKIKLTLI